MVEREKLIRAMEYCTGDIVPVDENDECLGDVCPFKEGGYESGDCQENMIRAALALLKEQESRVMAWEEIDKTGETHVWAEIFSSHVRRVALINCIVRQSEFFPGYYHLIEDSGVSWCRTELEYNKDEWCGAFSGWRCWTSRPTPEQMRDTKWEGGI